MVTGGGFWDLEERKCHPYLQEGQNQRSRELQVGQPNLTLIPEKLMKQIILENSSKH